MESRSSPRKAGRTAAARYRAASTAWRRRVFRRARWIFWIVIAASLLAGWFLPGHWKLASGLFAGAILGIYGTLTASPPAYIEYWEQGAWGERATARRLRRLRKGGWLVMHDLPLERGNLDHVAVGPGGIFLLDSKVLGGEADVKDRAITVTRIDDPSESYTIPNFTRRLGGTAADVKRRLERHLDWPVWIQPVVVLWCRFPPKIVEHDRVFFVHGDEVEGWLRARASRLTNLQIQEALNAIAKEYAS